MIVEAFCEVLRDNYEIAGVAFDGDELLDLVSRCPADCLLLDLILPGINGLELIPRVRSLQPAMKILVVTMLLDRAMADAALSAGADGFIPKDGTIAELQFAISEVMAGRPYVSPRVPKTSHRVGLGAYHTGLAALTPREHETILLLGEGKSETEIAHILGISLTTVSYHKHHMMRRLGIKNNTALLQFAVLARAEAERAPATNQA